MNNQQRPTQPNGGLSPLSQLNRSLQGEYQRVNGGGDVIGSLAALQSQLLKGLVLPLNNVPAQQQQASSVNNSSNNFALPDAINPSMILNDQQAHGIQQQMQQFLINDAIAKLSCQQVLPTPTANTATNNNTGSTLMMTPPAALYQQQPAIARSFVGSQNVAQTSSDQTREKVSHIPCRARGMPADHNYQVRT